MDIQGVSGAHLMPHLADGLDKGLALDISDGPTDLGDHNVGFRLAAHVVDKALDLVGDVGDSLHGASKIRAPALLGDDVGVDLSGGQIGILVQILVDEAFIVTQVKICLGAVLGNIDLAVLVGTHGAGVHIDIGIQLLSRYLQPPSLQQPPQRGCRNALSQSGYNAACYENILCHVLPSHGNLKRKSVRQGAKAP